MLITTTPNVEDATISKYLGLVTGSGVEGCKLKDLLGNIALTGRGIENKQAQRLETAKANAVSEMEEQANRLGANAIVGVNISFTLVGNGDAVYIATATGTAVKLEREVRSTERSYSYTQLIPTDKGSKTSEEIAPKKEMTHDASLDISLCCNANCCYWTIGKCCLEECCNSEAYIEDRYGDVQE